MRIITALILLCILHSAISAGDIFSGPPACWKDLRDSHVVEFLSWPTADVRMEAAFELLDRWEGKQFQKLLKDEPDTALEALGHGWPKNPGGLEADLIAIRATKDRPNRPLLAAGVLVRNRQLSRMYEDTPVTNEMRPIWFELWLKRIPEEPIFRGPLRTFQKYQWARKLLYEINKDNRHTSTMLVLYKLIVAIEAGESDQFEDIIKRMPAMQAMRRCVKENKNVLLELEFTSTPGIPFGELGDTLNTQMGRLTLADVICMALDKPDWAAQIKDKVAAITYTARPNSPFPASAPTDKTNKVLELMLLCIECKTTKVLASLDEYLHKKWPGFAAKTWDYRYVQHHEWFDLIRSDKKLREWWDENIGKVDWNASDPDFDRKGW